MVPYKLKKYWDEITTMQSDPHSIALGFSIGTFIAIIPSPGFNILLGVLVILIHPKVNKLALFGSMAIFNPITMIPIYIASYALGNAIFGTVTSSASNVWYLVLLNYTQRYLIGNLIIAFAISLVSYPAVYWVARAVQLRKQDKIKETIEDRK